MKNIWMAGNTLLIIALAIYIAMDSKNEKSGYIINQEIFDQYKGKIELSEQLSVITKSNKARVDSLGNLAETTQIPELIKAYQQAQYQAQLEEQELSEKYTADIWKRITQDVKTFGEEKGYHFIYGASGDGNLMFAKEDMDLTAQVVEYLNMKYQTGE